MKHSPAPWRIEEFWGIINICDADNSPVVYELAGGETEQADAALIAAAPDLLEACKALMRFEAIRDDEEASIQRNRYDTALSLIESAIAKAEGNVLHQKAQ